MCRSKLRLQSRQVKREAEHCCRCCGTFGCSANMREVKCNGQLLTLQPRGFGVGKRKSLLAYSFDVTFLIESPQSSQTNQTILQRRLRHKPTYEQCSASEGTQHKLEEGMTKRPRRQTGGLRDQLISPTSDVTLDHLSFAEYFGLTSPPNRLQLSLQSACCALLHSQVNSAFSTLLT